MHPTYYKLNYHCRLLLMPHVYNNSFRVWFSLEKKKKCIHIYIYNYWSPGKHLGL